MNEILLLYVLSKGQSTMYGLSKQIQKYFGFLTSPSFGTIQPTMKKFEKNKLITTKKFFTEGGKPYFSYLITDEGVSYLKDKLNTFADKNPIKLYPKIKISLICSDILNEEEKNQLYKKIKTELLKLKKGSETLLKSETFNENSRGRLILDTTVCEYNNMLDLVERFDNAGSC